MSEIKLRHNMHRAKYRGINKVQIQAYVAAYVINVKRLIAYIFIFIFMSTLLYVYLRWYAKYVKMKGFSTGSVVCEKLINTHQIYNFGISKSVCLLNFACKSRVFFFKIFKSLTITFKSFFVSFYTFSNR